MPWKSIGNGYLNLTSGTPTRLTANRTTPTANLTCNTIFIQQLQANTGKIYVMCVDNEVSQAKLNRTTGVGVVAIIPAPTLVAGVGTILPWVAVTIPMGMGALNAANFFLDTDVSDDDALISAIII